MARQKKRRVDDGGNTETAVPVPLAQQAEQIHIPTVQYGFDSCNPVEPGPGFASQPFSVGSFKEQCVEALQQLSARLAGCGPAVDADIDVSALRLPTLEDELAAVRQEAIAASVLPRPEGGEEGDMQEAHQPPAGVAGATAAAADADPAAAAEAAATEGTAGAAAAADGPAQSSEVPQQQLPSPAVVPAAVATDEQPQQKAEAQQKAAPASTSSAGRQQLPVSTNAQQPPPEQGSAANANAEQSESRDAAGDAESDLSALLGRTAVGRRVRVLSGGGVWRSGTVTAYSQRAQQHSVRFDEDIEAAAVRRSKAATEQVAFSANNVQLLGNDQQPEPSPEADTAPPRGRGRPAKRKGSAAARRPEAQLADSSQPADGSRPEGEGSGGAAGAEDSSSRMPAIPKLTLNAWGRQDMGKGFHPERELELVEGVKTRRRERMDAAQQELLCLQPVVEAVLKKHLRRRENNYAPAGEVAASADAAAALSGDPSTGALPPDELLLTVELAHPANPQRVSQAWRMRASQRLSELRDCLVCRSDADLKNAGIAVHSGFLYMEGVFYNDMRARGAVDYSYPIRTFCHHHRLQPPAQPAARDGAAEPSGAYACEEMERTTFEQLWLRIGAGAGAVYCHQGCCEHQLAFTDVRMAHPDDARRAYPQLIFQKFSRKRTCLVCKRAPACKVTYDDPLGPDNPGFWCLDCFNKMHYDRSGRLLASDFKVFDYIHD